MGKRGEKKSIWSSAERRAFAPPVKQTPTVWAESNRSLPPQIAAQPGPYRSSRTPYLREIQDAIIDPAIEEIVALKAAQIGWSECTRNILGFWIDNDPGPCLLVMPSEDAAKEILEDRIRPLIEHTPAVKQHLTDRASDNTKSGIKFDTMSLHLGWAGSPQALASRPCRYVICDEVDKYPPFSGKEADPISLARERTKTYQYRKKILLGSTPTTRNGSIWRAWEGCGDQRSYHVPCPHCGEFQQLVLNNITGWKDLGKNIADQNKLADFVEQHRVAYYRCEHCQGKIEDRHKTKMIQAGVWLSQGQTISKDGTIEGERPKSKRVGFHIPSLLATWVSFSDVAAEYLRSMGDAQKMMNFKNSTLAECFEEQVAGIKVNEVRQRAVGAPEPLIVPAWAGLTIASADVQGDRCYFVIRSWGHDHKSQLIHFGLVRTLAELYERCLNTPIRTEGGDLIVPDLLAVDANYRTTEVYEFCKGDSRIFPIRGAAGKQASPVQLSATTLKEIGVPLRNIDVGYFKDRLANLRDDPDRWLVNSAIDDEYCNHMAAEHKILIAGKNEERWEPVTKGSQNHLFDAEVYNIVGAHIAGVELIPEPDALFEMRRMERQQREQQLEEATINGRNKRTWLGDTSNWMGGVK